MKGGRLRQARQRHRRGRDQYRRHAGARTPDHGRANHASSEIFIQDLLAADYLGSGERHRRSGAEFSLEQVRRHRLDGEIRPSAMAT